MNRTVVPINACDRPVVGGGCAGSYGLVRVANAEHVVLHDHGAGVKRQMCPAEILKSPTAVEGKGTRLSHSSEKMPTARDIEAASNTRWIADSLGGTMLIADNTRSVGPGDGIARED